MAECAESDTIRLDIQSGSSYSSMHGMTNSKSSKLSCKTAPIPFPIEQTKVTKDENASEHKNTRLYSTKI